MSYESTWQCELCGKKTTVDNLTMPWGWTEIKVQWGSWTRKGQACHACTEGGSTPPQGMLKYWKQVIAFLKGQPPPPNAGQKERERERVKIKYEDYTDLITMQLAFIQTLKKIINIETLQTGGFRIWFTEPL